jgi:hypothetical protein
MTSAADDFDFLHGTWQIVNRKLTQRLRGCTEWEEFPSRSVVHAAFGGTANIDEISFPDGTYGLTVRLFNAERREWSLYWASSTTGTVFPPVVGTFADGVGTFYGDDTEGGAPVRVRFIWSGITATSARWEQSFSADGGATWESNWVMEMSRE